MKKLIEIVSLSPNFDILTQSTKPGLLLKYKEHGSQLQMQLDLMISQKEALNMFGIDDFSFASGKMAEVELEQNKDGKTLIKQFKFFDNRPVTMENIDLINKSLAHIISEMEGFKKYLGGNNQQKGNNNPTVEQSA